MEGDGSLNLKIDNGKAAGAHLELYESDTDATKDLMVIAEKLLGIRLSAYQGGELQASIDLEDLMRLLLEDLVPMRHIKKVTERIMIAL